MTDVEPEGIHDNDASGPITCECKDCGIVFMDDEVPNFCPQCGGTDVHEIEPPENGDDLLSNDSASPL